MKTKNLKVNGIILLSTLCMIFTGCGNKADKMYEKAMSQMEKGDLEAADKSFTEAIKLRDDYAQYYLDYGYCLIEEKDYKKASKIFKTVIQDKDNKIARENNKRAYRGMGIANYQNGNYKSAIKNFNKAIKIETLNELDVDIVSYMGASYLHLGNEKKALECVGDVLKKQPKNVDALRTRALIYQKQGDLTNSIKDYDAAIKIKPNDYNLYFGKYDLLMENGNEDEAKAVLDTITKLKIDEKKPEGQFVLAKIEYLQGNEEQARLKFEALLEQGKVESYLYLAQMDMTSANYQAALENYEAYKNVQSISDGSIFNNMATCYYSLGQYEKALECFESGLEVATASQMQSLMRGQVIVNEKLGNYEKAKEVMEQYLSNYPNDEEAKRDYEFLQTRVH